MKTRRCAYEKCRKRFVPRAKNHIFCSRQCKVCKARLEKLQADLDNLAPSGSIK